MTAPALSLPRKLLYAGIVSIIGVVLLLAGLEAALRLVHYGYSRHFARRVTLPDGEKVWRENRWVTAPYFSPALVRRPQSFRLPAGKAPGTYRIFVLGSSAAMGDPEPSFSIARVLETLLRAAYPDVRFEVVNAGITAINSHLTRLIAEDCAALEPDLFIVYEGHNEVIGPFGPSGVFTPFFRNDTAVRAAVWLKGTRTGQLVSAAARSLRKRSGSAGEWGGMQMFLDQQIPLGDVRLDAVRDHFRNNLLGIAAAAHRVGARTLICTVLTNQRDFAPFLSQHRAGMSSSDVARWNAFVASAATAERAGDLPAAEAAYRSALALDDDYAELLFRVGRLTLQLGRDPEAQAFLQRALDLDTLRFRTDSSLNRLIRDLRNANAPDLEVVDLASALAARSPHGLIGDELLYEHVHLTLRGAYEVAGELYARVAADLDRRGFSPTAKPLDYNTARLRLGFTVYEQAMIATELLNRFKAPPFTGQADHAVRLQTWEKRVESANALLSRPDALPALREIYRQALALAPDDWILARNAGAMFVARQAPAEALPLLERANAWIDDDIDTLIALGWAHRALGHAADAHAAFERARNLEPRYPGLPETASPSPQRSD